MPQSMDEKGEEAKVMGTGHQKTVGQLPSPAVVRDTLSGTERARGEAVGGEAPTDATCVALLWSHFAPASLRSPTGRHGGAAPTCLRRCVRPRAGMEARPLRMLIRRCVRLPAGTGHGRYDPAIVTPLSRGRTLPDSLADDHKDGCFDPIALIPNPSPKPGRRESCGKRSPISRRRPSRFSACSPIKRNVSGCERGRERGRG